MNQKNFSTAGFYAVPDNRRLVWNFNQDWLFYQGDIPNAQSPDFDDSFMQSVNLPHGIDNIGENASGMRNYQGVVWYRKKFKLDEKMQDKKANIYFDAAMGKARVYLNGSLVTEHFGGYLPFTVDLSDAYFDGRENVLAVWLDNSDDGLYPPGKPQDDLDFTYLGGIYRNVYLIETDSLHITHELESDLVAGGGVFVAVTDLQNDTATLEVRTEVANDSQQVRSCTLVTDIETQDGETIHSIEQNMQLQPGARETVVQKISLPNAHLWHPDDPYLHFVRSGIIENGNLVDALKTRFGVRLFEMRGKDGFFINRKFVGHALSGVNKHQDHVYVGNAMSNSAQWRDAKLLREGGVEIVRAAHYPLSPAFLDACDEFGLLVTSANPGWQFFNKEPIFSQRIYQDTHALVRRDRNRPSMLIWETTLNETDSQPVDMMSNLHKIVHEEIPFPGTFTAGDASHARPAGFDVLYHGNENDWQCLFRREYGDGDEVDNFYSQNAMVRIKREFGESAQLEQAKFRARDLADSCYNLPKQHFGSALWCGIDHQRGYHPDPFWGGILDLYRIPRMSYYAFKSQYDHDYKLPGIETGPMVYIAHELTQISGPDVVIFTNCDRVRLTWLGKEIGTAEPEKGYGSMPHPPVIFKNIYSFQEINTNWRDRTGEIEMIAEGIINGQVVCTTVKKYPERLTGIRLYVDDAGSGLVADGSDFVPVRADLIDNKGVRKVVNTEYITFEIEGEGEIINNDAVGVNPMKTQYGTATVLVRSTKRAGQIRIKASSPGLDSDTITFNSVPALLPAFDSKVDLANRASTQQPANAGAAPVFERAADADIAEKEKLIRELRLRLTEKEQEIMELRGQLNR